MISKKTSLVLLPMLCLPFLRSSAFASELEGSSQETPIAIKIIDSPIRLAKVTAPTFGTYYQSDDAQRLHATGDLFIEVDDKRESKVTPWKITYELSTFINGEEYNAKINIGKGIATSATGKNLRAIPKKLSLVSNNTGDLVEAFSTEEEQFSYRVLKEDISLDIPGNLPVGDFQGTQLVTLINTPSVD